MITKDEAIGLVQSIDGLHIGRRIRQGQRAKLYVNFPNFFSALITISGLEHSQHSNYSFNTGNPIEVVTNFMNEFSLEEFKKMVQEDFSGNDEKSLLELYEATSACLFSAKPTLLYKSQDNELAIKFPTTTNIDKLFQMHPELKSEVSIYRDKPTVIFIKAKIINNQLAACFKSEALRDRLVNILGLTSETASCSTVGDNAVLLLKSNVFFQNRGNIEVKTEPCLYKSAALNTFFAIRDVSSQIKSLASLGRLYEKHSLISELPLLTYMHTLPKEIMQQIALISVALLINDNDENQELAERTALTYL